MFLIFLHLRVNIVKKIIKTLKMIKKIRRYNQTIKDYLTRVNKFIQFRIDTTKFIIDRPKFDYQPLPWIKINKAVIRGEATFNRWEEMQKYLKDYKSLKDIGCCVGFFCFKAAETFGMNIVGIDTDARFIRIAEYTKKYVKNGKKVLFCKMSVDEKNVDILPQTDVTILFSIWHHWVHHYGIEKATQILKVVWLKTNNVLLFESGEEEMKGKFKLPFDKKASDWLLDYLISNLDGAKIEKVGEFNIGNYKNYKLQGHKRTVFAVIKN